MSQDLLPDVFKTQEKLANDRGANLVPLLRQFLRQVTQAAGRHNSGCISPQGVGARRTVSQGWRWACRTSSIAARPRPFGRQGWPVRLARRA